MNHRLLPIFSILSLVVSALLTSCHAEEMKCTLRIAAERAGEPEKVYPGKGNVVVLSNRLTGSFSFQTFSMSFAGTVAFEESPAAVSGILSPNNKVFERISVNGTYSLFLKRTGTPGSRAEVLHLAGSHYDLSCLSYDPK